MGRELGEPAENFFIDRRELSKPRSESFTLGGAKAARALPPSNGHAPAPRFKIDRNRQQPISIDGQGGGNQSKLKRWGIPQAQG